MKAERIAFVVLLTISAFAPVILADPADSAIGIMEKNTRAPELDLSAYSNVEYAIFTTSELSGGFTDLAEWRSKTGFRAEIFQMDDVIEADGKDQAEKLFNFISDLYTETDGGLEYVLLGGDADIIPTRYLWANASRWGLDDRYLSDVYYSSPGTIWDADGDNRYGERDDVESIGIENISFPVKVGRLPAGNISDVEKYVDRLISYETDPEEGGWTERAFFSTSLMDRPNVLNDPGTPGIDEGFDAYKDNAYKAFLNYTLPYIPRSLDLVQAHDYTEYQGLKYSGENDTLDRSTIPENLSEGCSVFAFAGQSFYDADVVSPPLAYSLAQWIDPSGLGSDAFGSALTYQEILNLTNGMKLPVAYISSCDSANFSDPEDRDLSNFLTAPNGGSICLVGSTGVSWRGEGEEYSLGNWYLMSRYIQKLLSTNRPGDALYELKEEYRLTKWDEFASKEPLLVGLWGYNFLGDPAMSAWIGTPREMMVSSQDSTSYAGGDTYLVNVSSKVGSPIQGAKVSIYMRSSKEVFYGYTGPDGKAAVLTNFSSGGNVTITVTKRNYVPEEIIDIISDQPSDLAVLEGSISTFPGALSEGTMMTVTADIINKGGRAVTEATVFLLQGYADTDPNEWTNPLATSNISIGGEVSLVEFEVEPHRSWESLSVAVVPAQGELDFSNNVASLSIDVNARPRFLPINTVEVEEDPETWAIVDISLFVFDPDNETSTLNFTLGSDAPFWITLEDESFLFIMPPPNWTGGISFTIGVTDGLASDTTIVDITVSPENDPPALRGLKSKYTTQVDTPFSLPLDIIDPEGDQVTVTLDSDLERLRLIGNSLRFIPYEEDIGSHEVEIRLQDSEGANASYLFELNVTTSSERLFFNEPSLHLPDATVGEVYSYTFRIGGDLSEGALFSDNSTLFDIDPEMGTIEFKPSSSDRGDHWIKVTVTSGNTTVSRSFVLEVVEGEDETSDWVYYVLGGSIIVIVLLLVAVYLWSGAKVEQYGLEE